jgi:hypothetical protein
MRIALTPVVEPRRASQHFFATAVVARLNKNWDEVVRPFDAVYDHILHMADALSDGVVKQYPERFRAGAVSTTGKR